MNTSLNLLVLEQQPHVIKLEEMRNTQKTMERGFKKRGKSIGSSQDSDVEECASILSKKEKSEILPLDLWTDAHRFTLINEVMELPALSDIRLPSYKLKQNDFLWPKVVQAASTNKQWKNPRDTFVKKNRTLQTMQTGSSTDQLQVQRKLFNAMQFLLGTMDILHNLLVDSIGGQLVAERYGTDDAFEHQDVVGQEGNVQTEAKRARDARSTLVVGVVRKLMQVFNLKLQNNISQLEGVLITQNKNHRSVHISGGVTLSDLFL
ncbi:unnamed protein product [Nippostrongylus brasiliensis]|uniref:MADF domain-containing protein n=1 Tax=Nippostrongylus brasiliensis TaxID=27835 RepID=A0A0N4XUG9_NIPBR|nr:unnamed protein product [Nippostrongylus brasiliensis]